MNPRTAYTYRQSPLSSDLAVHNALVRIDALKAFDALILAGLLTGQEKVQYITSVLNDDLKTLVVVCA